ncbi:MAG: CobD/CbiB family protein [Burkholderiaceae bacterium]|nr:CobD/CbiB family protein [Burkholderiaceae bacterium]
MSFFAILVALLIEQVRPLSQDNGAHAAMRNWARWCRVNFDAGRGHDGWVVWGLAVGLPTLVTLVVHALLLTYMGWPAAVLWSVAILYLTLGFRQFSHHFTDIRDALDAGDEALARERLARWQRVDAADLPRSEIVRHVIEYSVLAAHRHVFGVLFWFSVLAAVGLGPTGAVFYRMSEFMSRYGTHRRKGPAAQPLSESLVRAAQGNWAWIDWLPARITALGFAVVGSFEDAIDGWRNYAQRFPNDNDGVILAATAGALDVRLGGRELQPAFLPDSSQTLQGSPAAATAVPPATPGREPEVAHLAQVVGLVWRTVVMWMVLLALLTLARLLG